MCLSLLINKCQMAGNPKELSARARAKRARDYIYIYMYIYIYAYIYICRYIYICVYIYIYDRVGGGAGFGVADMVPPREDRPLKSKSETRYLIDRHPLHWTNAARPAAYPLCSHGDSSNNS